ncbi:MAG: hypothetical protein M9950_06125 [Thermomicrobiales bacterium]|nr:hypothetical protein [Thermomicrobiales bacterium]
MPPPIPDNRNIMGAQVAKTIFRVPHVIVRLYDPVRAEAYRTMGLDTICPTTTISGLILDMIDGYGHQTGSN